MALRKKNQIQSAVNRLNRRYQEKRYVYVDSHANSVPQNLRRYDNDLFILYNFRKDKYEVHSLDNKGTETYCFTVPHAELDDRTIQIAIRGDMKGYGNKFLSQTLMEEEKLIAKQEKERKEFTRDFAREYQSLFKKAKSDMGL